MENDKTDENRSGSLLAVFLGNIVIPGRSIQYTWTTALDRRVLWTHYLHICEIFETMHRRVLVKTFNKILKGM